MKLITENSFLKSFLTTAFNVLQTAVKNRESLKAYCEKVRKVQSSNIRRMIPIDLDKALALYEAVKETVGMDESFDNLKD